MDKIELLDTQKIIILGCGAVGKCVLYYLDSFFKYRNENVYVVEKNLEEKDFPTVAKAIEQGVNFVNYTISENNLDELFLNIVKVKKFDLVIDLTTRTNTFQIFKKVRAYSLLYINTSIEDNRSKDNYVDKSIFSQHLNLIRLDEKLKNSLVKPTTTLIEYGMNPGLISTFVRYGLKRLTKEVLEYQIENGGLNEELYEAYQLNKYNSMAKLLKLRVIHCSEIDTQVPQKIGDIDKLYNTWSCLGLIDEGCDPLEIILGSHENLPKIIEKMGLDVSGIDYSNFYEQVLMVNKPCYSVKVNSVVPNFVNNNITFEKIEGRCIHHGESISLNRFLSDETYSPTIHYVYKLSPLTSNYLDNREPDGIKQDGLENKWKVMNMYENQLNGNDNIGALFILEDNPKQHNGEPYMYWTGSILSTNYTRDILGDKYFGPTTIQVMSGILSGLSYIIENKEMGLVFGEAIPESYVIPRIKKYLGYFYSGEVVNSNIKIHTELNNLLC